MTTKQSPSKASAPANPNASSIAHCEVLVDDHEHAGTVCAKGDKISIPIAVAETLAKFEPPRVKVLTHA